MNGKKYLFNEFRLTRIADYAFILFFVFALPVSGYFA